MIEVNLFYGFNKTKAKFEELEKDKGGFDFSV